MSEMKRVSEMAPEEIKSEVKKTYAKVAERTYDEPKTTGTSCCGPAETSEVQEKESSCCGSSKSAKILSLAAMGYEIEGIPDSAIESYAGCGNPVALASLKQGEYVLDLGSGAGLDIFAAAKKVGETGRVIGVDMTTEMIEKAEQGARKLGLSNVEFRLGDIESLPLDNKSVDVIISNCVINLAPDKVKVFQEAFRVLRPGGRMMISDIVLEENLPEAIRNEIATYTGCLGGAILADEYLQLMRDAGFERVEIVSKSKFGPALSAKIAAYKPK